MTTVSGDAPGGVRGAQPPAWAGAVRPGLPLWPGAGAAGLVALLTLGPLVPLLLRADSLRLLPADLSALRFTLLQASLSAFLSVALAIPLARALSRRAFPGRGVIIGLLGAPFILPVVVAILGLLAVFGRSGLFNRALESLGLSPVPIYGLQGVVLAHVFFNLPLATRLILLGWQAIPAERFRLAATLDAPVGLILERPLLRATVPAALMTVFLICLTSFAVALMLGGGPAATTLELAIYQALRFDFAPGRAAVLAIAQMAICTLAAALALRAGLPGFGTGLDRLPQRFDRSRWDGPVIMMATLFLGLPLLMVVARGAPGLLVLPPGTGAAALRSLCVALAAAAIATGLALALALRRGRLMQIAGTLPLAASGLVTGTGLLLLLLPLTGTAQLALPVTALVNGTAALPFALRAIAPALAQAEAATGRLSDTLALTGWPRLRIALLPRLRRPLGFAAGLSAAMSAGDLGVVALFATEGQETLPLLIQRLMGAYRMEAAAGAGLVLLALSLSLFWVFDRGGRGRAAT